MEAGVGFAGNGHKKPCFFPKNIGVSEKSFDYPVNIVKHC
jgi:hypothetical protein